MASNALLYGVIPPRDRPQRKYGYGISNVCVCAGVVLAQSSPESGQAVESSIPDFLWLKSLGSSFTCLIPRL